MVIFFGWAFLIDNKPSRIPAIIAGFFLPQRSPSIFPLDKFTRSAFSSCRSPKSLVLPSRRLTIGHSRPSRGFSVSPFFFLDFQLRFSAAGSNALDRARLCLPPLFVLAAALSFPLLAFGGTNFGSSILVTG